MAQQHDEDGIEEEDDDDDEIDDDDTISDWNLSKSKGKIQLPALVATLLRTIHILYNALMEEYNQWFFIYSQSYATITTVNFGAFSSPQEETLFLLAVTPHFLPVPQPKAPTSLSAFSPDLPVLDIAYKWSHTICGPS